MKVPPPARTARRARRFDQPRATLALLLLSAAVFGASALKAAHVLPERAPHPSVWDGTPDGTR
ncbi:hypothetical protein [Deinococcus aquiradiocola]|uniref:hypothetical protein n=1 Tax=Deinococcus aquiradiocola TaxID=393059 RepID=UPI00166EFB11|nr:hypothetical protein [Deinococcus aquiradiocola]